GQLSRRRLPSGLPPRAPSPRDAGSGRSCLHAHVHVEAALTRSCRAGSSPRDACSPRSSLATRVSRGSGPSTTHAPVGVASPRTFTPEQHVHGERPSPRALTWELHERDGAHGAAELIGALVRFARGAGGVECGGRLLDLRGA